MMAMVESKRVRMLSEGAVGKDLISEKTWRGGMAGALSYVRQEAFLSDGRSGLTALD